MDPTQSVIQTQFLSFTAEQAQALGPYAWVLGGIILAILVSVIRFTSPKWPVFVITVATAAAGIWMSIQQAGVDTPGLFGGMMAADHFSTFFNILFLASAGITALASFRYLDREGMQHPEYYVLTLLSAFGMMLMASATNLIVVFIALELMSLAVYVLVGFRRSDRRSNEAAMKYFVLGSAASAVMLYGAALLYGATGTTNLREILSFIHGTPAAMDATFTLGAWLTVVGFLFKTATVPFHMWMPDVYEGAPAPITGFMTTGIKAASFAAFVRVFALMGYGNGFSDTLQRHMHDILWVAAVLTMAIGNLIALTQTNLKRMLAYSSIAHSGYLLVGLIAAPMSESGYAPVALYLVAYSIMNLGAFVLLTMISSREDQGLNLHDLSGLSQRQPWLAFAMAVFMFSMAGIPPTAGFAAKYLLFYSAVQANEIWLVVISVLCSAISVYYYLRVLVYMYMHQPQGSPSAQRNSAWAAAAVGLMVILTVQIGVLPSRMIAAARRAVVHF